MYQLPKHYRLSLLAIFMIESSAIFAELPFGIIGGENYDTNAAYAALVAPSGTLTQLSGASFPTTSGVIYSVAINNSNAGIIGGRNNTTNAAYAALVASNGTLTQLSGANFPATSGEIYSVAINNSNAGIIGGKNYTLLGAAYAALVAPNGALTQLSGANFPATEGTIRGVAINNSNVGMIGGHNNDTNAAYAALVAPNGTLTQLSGGNIPASGNIVSVAINDSSAGIIGGQNTDTLDAYAALVAPNGTLTQLSGANFPAAEGAISSVAINDSNTGLIGGRDASAAYAALVAPNGTLTQLSGANIPTTGYVTSVAINNSNTGIIGAWNNVTGAAYAALVAPNGTLTQLSGANFPAIGTIASVAITDSGVGIIGGKDQSTSPNPAYAALVAPNGTLTQLSGANFPATGYIRSVAINDISVAINDIVTPQSIGPYTSVIYSQLAASKALSTHLMTESMFRVNAMPSMELAVADPICKNDNRSKGIYKKRPKNLIWMAPFGDYVHIRQQGNIPAFTNTIAGVIAAYDHHLNSDLMLGAGLGYAYNYVHYLKGLGHGKLNEEILFIYSDYQVDHFRLNAAIGSGLYQLHNERYALNLTDSTAHTRGWILSPHIEFAFPFQLESPNYFIEPFASCDWVNNWQRHFTESGKSGFNLVMDGLYASLVQSELGLRFYEKWQNSRGTWLFEEKCSYVNQAPIHYKAVNTFFIQSISVFPIATGSSKIQNLGNIQLSGHFLPNNLAYPYAGVDLQTMLGTSYQSYYASFNIGKYF